MSRTKAIIFDFDGVIVASNELRFGIDHKHNPELTFDEWRNTNFGKIKTAKTNVVLTDSNFFEEYEKRIESYSPFFGIQELIKDIAETNKLFIITRTPEKIIRNYLRHYCIESYFELILSSESGHNKAEEFKRIFREFDVTSNNVLFLTDTTDDIDDARTVDVRSIAVTWGQHTREKLLSVRPYGIIDRPGELIDYLE